MADNNEIDKKKQHYVPQFYLKGFKIMRGQSSMVRVFDKSRKFADRKAGTSIKVAGQESYYYKILVGEKEDKTYIERNVLEHLDDQASKILKEVCAWAEEDIEPKSDLPFELWRGLGSLLYLLHIRTPNARISVDGEYGGNFNQHFKLLESSFDSESEKFYDSFVTRKIFILKPPPQRRFITSDDPVIMLPKRQPGVLYKSQPDWRYEPGKPPHRSFSYSRETEVIFPLNNRVLLWIPEASPYNVARARIMWTINRESLRQINRLIYDNSHRWVYASDIRDINLARSTRPVPLSQMHRLLKINNYSPLHHVLELMRK